VVPQPRRAVDLAASLLIPASAAFGEGVLGGQSRAGQAGLGVSVAPELPSAESPRGNGSSLRRYKKPE